MTELTRNGVCVVCSGPKAILDIDATVEFLETLSVPLVTKGPLGAKVPAFWSRESNSVSPIALDSDMEIANFFGILLL